MRVLKVSLTALHTPVRPAIAIPSCSEFFSEERKGRSVTEAADALRDLLFSYQLLFV